MKRILFALALLASPALAATTPAVNLTNIKAAERATPDRGCVVTQTLLSTTNAALWANLKKCQTPSPTPTPTPTPTPAPTPSPSPSPSPAPTQDLSPPAPIASNFDTAAEVLPAAPTPSNAPDVIGAFRFLCKASHASNDDPIVYPGQPGASHRHRFFGNTGTNAYSTYQTLRTTGESTCQNKLNRSGYWIPALFDGKGNEVVPDYIADYYKRLPASDPRCHTQAARCEALPPGMREIFGWNMARPDEAFVDGTFKCSDPSGVVVTGIAYKTMTEALAICPVGKQLLVMIDTAPCWTGTDIDSPDHRSHTARQVKDASGALACPPTHPVLVPVFTATSTYTIAPGDDPSLWRFSCDAMAGNVPGACFHMDTLLAWDPPTEAAWTDNCINKLLSCAMGDLGNGTWMKFDAPFSFTASPHLVPVTP